MKKVFTIIFVFCSLLTSIEIFPQERNIIQGELLVQFRPEANLESFENSFTQYEVETDRLLSRRMNIWLVKLTRSMILKCWIRLKVTQRLR